ncbi:MAG: hypothetical protein KGO02_16935 [Alphaproteobacteria bacterium]|nr:hypothetical protein [Alphaproteobacteria bacterium]
MASSGAERGQPVLLQAAENLNDERILERPRRRPPPGSQPLIGAGVLGAFWLGAAGAYAFGYLGANSFGQLLPQQIVILLAASVAPPVLLLLMAWAFVRGEAMRRTAADLADVTDRLFTADETAARTAARLARAVRRELDGLNQGLDSTTERLRTLETSLKAQITALDETGSRIELRAGAVSTQLAHERDRLDAATAWLSDSATRASEDVAIQTAKFRTMMEDAQADLSGTCVALAQEADKLRAAVSAAAEAPQLAAGELDRQSQRIEAVCEAAMARAEVVLERHERHRSAMIELLGRLKADGGGLEQQMAEQRHSLNEAALALKTEAARFAELAAQGQHDIEQLMSTGSAQAEQMTAAFAREAGRLRDNADLATAALSRIVDALKEAGTGTQALIGDAANEARLSAKALISEAMGETQQLLQLSARLTEEAREVKTALTGDVSELEQHLSRLPALAQQEAEQVRTLIRRETEALLDLSAQTLARIHSHTSTRAVPAKPENADDMESEDGLRGLARKFTQRPKRKDGARWQMRQLLAAVDSSEGTRTLKPGAAAALGALEAALSDLAIDLNRLLGADGASTEDWRRYAQGDRSVFARRLAQSIDADSLEHITALYRDDDRFREAANIYLNEFELLLERAREGDGDGLLISSLLRADTGKIYLAVAYALGRLG